MSKSQVFYYACYSSNNAKLSRSKYFGAVCPMVRFGFAHWNEELLVLAMEEIEMNSVMYQSMALFMKVQA